MMICDKCMCERMKTESIKPHWNAFGGNVPMYRETTCDQCGKTKECIQRYDIKKKGGDRVEEGNQEGRRQV